jgi:glycosyltransferase involved in cell wall biosynthesis
MGGFSLMGQPRITVAMPVYNDPDGARRSVPTVFGQTWQGPLRLLIIDDGSNDATPEALASLADAYQDVEIVRNAQNRGRPAVRNQVLDLVSDGYLAWIDAGDLWHPRKLELQIAALLEEEKHDSHTPLLCTGPFRWVFVDRSQVWLRVPDTQGDQLLSALNGTLFPYLQAIIGRVENFRAVGGFDDRLLRRQDYDFLVRFIGEGGRVIATASHTPVFTYIKSDVGRSGAMVAGANRIIRAKHAPYYGRYQPELRWRVRHNQDLLVSRYFQNNGQLFRAKLYLCEAQAIKLGLTLSNGRLLRSEVIALQRRARRVAGGVAGRMVSAPRTWRQAARRLAVRLVGRGRDGWSSTEELETIVAQGDRFLVPEAWLWLEESYRKQGLLVSAESALRRGLDRYPNHHLMMVRLIELLPQQRKLTECVELWSRKDVLDGRALRAITYARVARAYRELGDSARAVEVAEEGLRRFPHEARLREEIYRNRAALVAWQGAINGREASVRAHVETRGVVTDLGFLIGGSGPVRGKVTMSEVKAPSISLVVNELPVVTSFAVDSYFAISAHGILPYLGDGDVISVACEGHRLLIEGMGVELEVTPGYQSRFDELERRLAAGYVFNKFGSFRKGYTPGRKKEIMRLYDEVADILQRTYGYILVPFYGNLLGAVREHDFIPHDVGGFDAGYFSRNQSAEDVRREFVAICRTFVEHGYHLLVEPWSAYIKANRIDRVFLDLNYAWFAPEGELNLSFGWRYPPLADAERVRHSRQAIVGGHLVRIPGNAEEVLTQIYGPTWVIPDQGFDLNVGLERRADYLLTAEDMATIQSFDRDRVRIQFGQQAPDA